MRANRAIAPEALGNVRIERVRALKRSAVRSSHYLRYEEKQPLMADACNGRPAKDLISAWPKRS